MKKKLLKVTALVIALNLLTTALAPTLTYALTAGPTAPEYTSFEPIDTTDMVDLATGDFTYNVPLLEVPGPEGGYPLALSYHAGISPEEEASWVGLGWSLNAGAINRIVNVHPDDMNNKTITIHDTWSGGESQVYSIGVGVGISSAVSASVGIEFAKDTYKGTGIGVRASAGVGLTGGSSGYLGAGVSAGLGPYGDGYVGLSINGGTGGNGATISSSIGVMASFSDGETQLAGTAGTGVSYSPGSKQGPVSMLDADISTNSSRPSMSVAGISAGAISDNSTNVINSSSGFSVSIPIAYVNLNFGYESNRYYVDAVDLENQTGVLYANTQDGDRKQSFDSYSFKSTTSTNPFFDKDVNTSGGSVPAYDVYNVVAQGLSGSIQPYLFESGTITRKVQWTNVGGVYYPADNFAYNHAFKPYSESKKVSFRFLNEFSNSMVLNADNLFGDFLNNYKIPDAYYQIGNEQLAYNNSLSKDFNSTTGALAGTKHVEWFTNAEITQAFDPGTAHNYPNKSLAKGFIPNITDRDTYFSDGIYGVNVEDNIGGFMITNASGVNYHYAQPVYNFEEIQVSYANSALQGNSYRRIEKPVPYAYSWLLTGITGPDYVDRGIIGQIDEADWGYWVKFEYGKWTDQFIWRTPNDGTEKDNWSEWQSYNAGKKELYYLDAIITRTHTALFVKDIRQDAKGIKEKEAGGFGVTRDGSNQVTNCSASSLRLSRVLLFSNRVLSKAMEDDLSIMANDASGNAKVLVSTREELKAHGTGQPNPVVYVPAMSANRRLHYHEKVLTEKDLLNSTSQVSIAAKASRQIVFNHDYSLCQNTPNSLNIDYGTLVQNASPELQKGKLSLNSVSFLGYEGKKVVPPTRFTYYNTASYVKNKKDVWGLYKSDTDTSTVKQVYQRTTNASSYAVNAWSLKRISTNIGADIEIEYESDRYKTVVVNPNYNISVASAAVISSTAVRLTTNSSELLTNISELAVNQFIRLKYVVKNDLVLEGGTIPLQTSSNYKDIMVKIVSIGSNYLNVESTELYTDFKTTSEEVPANGTGGGTVVRNTIHSVVAMNMLFARNPNLETYGGGLRVKSISLKADNIINMTTYTYANGVTAYEPFDLNVNLNGGAKLESSTELKQMVGSLYKDYYINIAANTSFLPSPGVVYERVLVKEAIIDLNTNPQISVGGVNFTTYNFVTYNQNMLPRQEGPENDIGFNKFVKKVKMKDFRNFVGALKEMTVRSSATNAILTKTTNSYLHDLTSNYSADYPNLLANNYNNQGRIEHMYYEDKLVGFVPNESASAYIHTGPEHLLITEIEEYPVVPIGQTVLNGKTNISKETKTIAFDYYTGEPKITYRKDGMGYHYLEVNKPAYEIPAYGEMGLKVINPSNKNMLTQMATTTSYLVTPTISNPMKETDFTKTGVMSASAQTWFKNGIGIVYPTTVTAPNQNYSTQGIWMKGTSYTWLGDENAVLSVDGRYPYSSFSAFNFNSGTNPQWQMTEEVTQYDVYSHALESRDFYNKYSAVLMDPLCIQVTAASNLASRNEIAYAGTEYNEYYKFGEGRVTFMDGTVSSNNAHTGKNSLAVGSGNKKGFNFEFVSTANRKYQACVWVYQPGGVKADGSQGEFNPRLIARNKTTGAILATGYPSEAQNARGFYRLAIDIIPTAANDQIEVYCLNANSALDKPQYFDDFRVHPLDASFTSYVYDLDKGWLTHILDNDNFYTRYQYDHAGKLTAVYKELFRVNEKIVTTNQYNYGRK